MIGRVIAGAMTEADGMDDRDAKLDRANARIANAAVESLTSVQQCSIHNVYIADVWKHRGDPVATFIEAAAVDREQKRRMAMAEVARRRPSPKHVNKRLDCN